MRSLIETLRRKFQEVQEVNSKRVKIIEKEIFFNVVVPCLKNQKKLYEFMGIVFDKTKNLFIHTSSPKIWIGDDIYELPKNTHRKLLLKNLSKFVSDKEVFRDIDFEIKLVNNTNDEVVNAVTEPPKFLWGVKYEDIFEYRKLSEIPVDVLNSELKNEDPETFFGYFKVGKNFLISISSNSSVLYIDDFGGFERYRFKSFEDKYILFQQMLEKNIRNIQNRGELIF